MWIGVLSDTQGELHPEIPAVFDGMDFNIHCGGIGAATVLEELSHICPVSGVIGTGDSEDDYPFGKVLARQMGGINILVSHRVGTPARPTQIGFLARDSHQAASAVL